MSDYDAGLWHSESDPRLRSTIVSVWVLDRMPDDGDFEAMLAASVEDIPRLRQRVVQDALELAPPRWEVDPNFDPAYHLRKLTLGGKGNLRDLLDLAEPIAMQAFDKDRPLWEFYLIDGLEGGRAGAIMKLHHAVSDGVGLVKMTKSMVERDRETAVSGVRKRRLADLPAPEAKETADRLRDALAHRVSVETERVGRVAGGALRWLGALASDPVGTLEGARDMAASVGRMLRPITEPMSPVMRDRGMALALDAFTVPLADVKRAALAAGGSVNDLFVAAVAGGMRLYHEHHGKPVDELQMMMPINLRGDGEKAAKAGNQFAPSRFLVPVGTVDPRERVALIQERVREQRREPALPYLDDVTGVINRLPRAATRNLMEGMLTSIDFVTSNVPGPRRPVYTAGARIEHMFPFGPPAGAAVNITLFSYDGICHLGMNADRTAVPDPQLLSECLRKGLDEMLALE